MKRKNLIYFAVFALFMASCNNNASNNNSDSDYQEQTDSASNPEGTTEESVIEINSDSTSEKIHEFSKIDVIPQPKGGMDGFRKYIADNVNYPKTAADNNVSGTVHVNFTVEKDGSITNVKVDRKLGSGLDDEAIRVVKASEKWSPGIQNGEAVRVQFNVPVKFALK